MSSELNHRKTRGYRNLVSPSTVPLGYDHPRPHRKDLMDTIFSSKKKSQSHKIDAKDREGVLKLLGIGGKAKDQIGELSLGLGSKLGKVQENAVANSIERHNPTGISGLPYVLRPTIRIPPLYEAKLKSLQPLGKQLARRQKEITKFESDAQLSLKVKPGIFPENSNSIDLTDPHIPHRLFDTPDEINQKRPSIESKELFTSCNTSETVNEHRSKRNVDYMLEIWKLAEGMHDNKTSQDSENKSAEEAKEINIEQTPLEIEFSESERHNSNNSQEVPGNVKYLSSDTIEQLMRISKYDYNDQHNSSMPAVEKVQRTLMGYDSRTGKQANIEMLCSPGQPESRGRVTETPFSHLTPGNCIKEFGNYISEDGDLLPITRPKTKLQYEVPFEMGIPAETFADNSDEIGTGPRASTSNQSVVTPQQHNSSANVVSHLMDVFGKVRLTDIGPIAFRADSSDSYQSNSASSTSYDNSTISI
jgi:hypothetical protein